MIDYAKVPVLNDLAKCVSWDQAVDWHAAHVKLLRKQGTIALERRLEIRVGNVPRETFSIGGWIYTSEHDIFLYGTGATMAEAIRAAFKGKGSTCEAAYVRSVAKPRQGVLPLE